MSTVWLMVFFSIHANSVTGAMGFTSKETCEAAAVQMVSAVAVGRFSPVMLKPVCIQVKK
jgi:hypothetical protein